MKTWEMLKAFTESEVPNTLKAYIVTRNIKNDKNYPYGYISLLDGVFYWNNDYNKPFRINNFYNPLQIEWEFKDMQYENITNETIAYRMDQMSEELINRIEIALNITFYEWQHKFLLNEPMLLDMRITGRCTGKTLVFIIKKLFENPEPLLFMHRNDVCIAADWWSCETRIDRALGNHYLEWYRREFKNIYEELNRAGIVTRKVVF